MRQGNNLGYRFRSIAIAFATAALVLLTISATARAATFTPGSYAVSMKYVQNERVVVRLAMYSFRSDYTFRADYWEWDNGPITDSGALIQRIGTSTPPSGPSTDAPYWVVGSMHFRGATGNGNENLTTRFGTWSTYKTTNIKIVWGDTLDIEWWKRSWHDSTLNKIELFYLSYAKPDPRDTNLYLNQSVGAFYRNGAAKNAGYGFGSDGVGFTSGFQTVAPFRKYMKGQFVRWNRYCITIPSECQAQGTTLDSFGEWSNHFDTDFQVTSTGILRHYDALGTVGAHSVFTYLAIPPGNTGMTSRRVSFQISHDFDDDGYVQDNYGHLYNGLQIIDSAQVLRGAVFADTTIEPPWLLDGMYILSAMFLLDDGSSGAQTGIEDSTNW